VVADDTVVNKIGNEHVLVQAKDNLKAFTKPRKCYGGGNCRVL
jgi:hypothetical protein